MKFEALTPNPPNHLTKAKDRTGKMFGLDRFCEVVKTATGSLKKKRATIIATLLEHIHDQPHSDDITMVCLRRK